MLAEKTGGEITEYFFPRDFAPFCTGCANCITKSETLCPHYALLKPITEAIDEADVLIFASPVYVMHASGAMKSFLDHYGYRFMLHRPERRMFSKQAVCIATAAGDGTKSAVRDMADSLYYWGAAKIYTYGKIVRALSPEGVTEKMWAEIDRDTTRLASRIRRSAARVRPGVKTKAYFMLMRFLQLSIMKKEADVAYWKQQGWDGAGRPWK
jgi:Multimeric flavodoxin WrbA